MSRISVIKVILYSLNIASFIVGIAIVVSSIWFFIQIHEITSLRNKNHYLLDYNIYWPQAIPWIFFVVAIFVLPVSYCGITGVHKSSHNLIKINLIFLGIILICLITTAVVALVLADDKSIEKFVTDIFWDVYSQTKTDNEAAEAFGHIERKLHCCGVGSPRDYKNWKNEFPMSCCDGYDHGWLEPFTNNCEFSNKLANERHGCAAVASQYAGIIIKALSGASIFTAVIASISLVATFLGYQEF